MLNAVQERRSKMEEGGKHLIVTQIFVTNISSYINIDGLLSKEICQQLHEKQAEGKYRSSDLVSILDTLDEFGYKVIFQTATEKRLVWTLKLSPAPTAMKHLVVESSSYIGDALILGAVPPELRDVDTKQDAISVIDTLSKYGYKVVSQSQVDGGRMTWTLGKQL